VYISAGGFNLYDPTRVGINDDATIVSEIDVPEDSAISVLAQPAMINGIPWAGSEGCLLGLLLGYLSLSS